MAGAATNRRRIAATELPTETSASAEFHRVSVPWSFAVSSVRFHEEMYECQTLAEGQARAHHCQQRLAAIPLDPVEPVP